MQCYAFNSKLTYFEEIELLSVVQSENCLQCIYILMYWRRMYNFNIYIKATFYGIATFCYKIQEIMN